MTADVLCHRLLNTWHIFWWNLPPDPHLLVRKPKPHATPGDPARQGGSARSHPELQPVRIWHLNNRENHPSHIDRELELGETRWGEREMMTPPREGFLGERAGSSNSCSIRQPLLHLYHRQLQKDLLQDLEKESQNGHCGSRRRSH